MTPIALDTMPANRPPHPLASDLARVLFSPGSVAIIGASDDTAKTTGRPLKYLRSAGFAGRVYPVNPHRAMVQGERAYACLADLPEVPEHVFVLTPTDAVIDSIREAARLGVRVATVLANGFSETGPEGAAREAVLTQIARASGMRLLGPNSLGLAWPSSGLLLTANAAFAEPELPAGRLFVASHSGSMIGALLSRGKARGVGFAGLVSVGNESDLSLGEICAATLDHPEIDGYLLFLESLRHGDALRAFALEAARRGKPVIAYKLGRSAAAAEMAATHTGALAGEDDVAEAFFRGLGIARVECLETLLEAFPLARRMPLTSGDTRAARVGVVTTTGGGAAMAVDQIGIRDVVIEPASADTMARLHAAGVSASPGRVLDLTLAGTRPEVMRKVLDVLLTAPEFDLVLAVAGSSARFQPELVVQPILEAADRTKPLAALLVPDAPVALARLTAAGVPCFRTPESCGDAIAAVLRREVPAVAATIHRSSGTAPRSLSEAEGYEVLDALGISRAPAITVGFGRELPALPFDYPVAAKVCSADIAHKTDVGGVVLGIADAAGLQAAIATIRDNVSRNAAGARCDEVLVQPMRKGLAEVLVGYRVDPEAGPLVLLAAGGIWAEVYRDRSLRLAPVTHAQALEMIGEVALLKTVSGLRGRPRGDLSALADTIVVLSQLAGRADWDVIDAEINPLMILPEGQGVFAVDALIRKA
jgi:acyl-CoA synthetase (NDP forming)